MGRGRRPKPNVLRMLQGNPGGRPLNMQEPQYRPGPPDKPLFLDDFASEEWDRLVGMLVSARVLTTADVGILVVAASAYSQLRQCEEFLKKKGSLSYDSSSTNSGPSWKPFPEVGQINVARREYRAALAEMGLSPASRGKVRTLPEPAQPKGSARFFTS